MPDKVRWYRKPSLCPWFDIGDRHYIIQDRYVGGTYEYALVVKDRKMNVTKKLHPPKETKDPWIRDFWAHNVFRKWYQWKYGTAALIDRSNGINCCHVSSHIVCFIDEDRKELAWRDEGELLTGWFQNYRECVDMATDIVQRELDRYNSEKNGCQLSLLSADMVEAST